MKKNTFKLYYIALLSVFIMLLLIGLGEKTDKFEERKGLDYETVEGYESSVREDADTPLGMEKIYTWTLPEAIKGDTSLAFYYVHQYVRVYIENKLVFSVFPSEQDRISRTLGCDWVMVPLYQEDAGKSVRIEIIPVYKATINREPQFFIGSRLGIFLAQAQNDKWQIVMSLLSVVIGVVFTGIACYCIFIQRKQKKDLLFLGMFSMMLGIWKLMDTRFSPLLFQGNAMLQFYLSVTMLMLGAVPLLKKLQACLYENEYVLVDIFCALFSAVSILFVVLQLLGIVDIREVLKGIHVMILLGILVVIILEVYERLKLKKRGKNRLLWICAAGGVLDIIAYYVKGNSSGLLFSLAAFQIYILCTGIIVIKDHFEREKKISEQEAALAESKVAIMLSQIQPHFLYNSLNSIYYLCGKDSDAARRTIKDFADYLRGNMDSLKQKTPVAFEKELKHIEVYLSLEKMRFEEKLQVEYEIEVKDFRIPSLSVQPLVENAVKHGVGKSPNGGTIVISTRKYKDCYEVIVADNGVGYDVNKTPNDGRTHIGISNVKSRLWEMSRATLDIVSAEGEGTTATIRIPKQS